MGSKVKLGGSNTNRKLQQASARLRCTEDCFLMAVSSAVTKAGGTPCPQQDIVCVNAQALPYIDAVLAGRQTRLPFAPIVASKAQKKVLKDATKRSRFYRGRGGRQSIAV